MKVIIVILITGAVNGFKNSLYIGGKNRNKTFQDLLRLIDIFFSLGDKNDNLLSLISETFNHIDVDAFLNVIPQLLCRFDILYYFFMNFATAYLKHANNIFNTNYQLENHNEHFRLDPQRSQGTSYRHKRHPARALVHENDRRSGRRRRRRARRSFGAYEGRSACAADPHMERYRDGKRPA